MPRVRRTKKEIEDQKRAAKEQFERLAAQADGFDDLEVSDTESEVSEEEAVEQEEPKGKEEPDELDLLRQEVAELKQFKSNYAERKAKKEAQKKKEMEEKEKEARIEKLARAKADELLSARASEDRYSRMKNRRTHVTSAVRF